MPKDAEILTPSIAEHTGDFKREWHIRQHRGLEGGPSGKYYIAELDPGMQLLRETAEHIAALHNHWRRLDEVRRREWLKPGPEHYPSLEVTE